MKASNYGEQEVEEKVAEYQELFLPSGIVPDDVGDTKMAEIMYKIMVKTYTDWLRQALLDVYNSGRESLVNQANERYPVPDMNMAEVWPHDEQVRWAGIGEVMVYLQEVTKK